MDKEKTAGNHALRFKSGVTQVVSLQSLDHMARTDAARAGLDGLDTSVSDSFDFLKIRVPHSTGFVVGVAHIVTETGAFTTDIAFSGHSIFPPYWSMKETL